MGDHTSTRSSSSSSDDTDDDDDQPLSYTQPKLRLKRPTATNTTAPPPAMKRRRRVSWVPGTVSPPLSAKRLHRKARLASDAQVAAKQPQKSRKRPRFRVRRGSREKPCASAVAIVDPEQLYVTLTNDTLWSRPFAMRADHSAIDTCAAGPWKYVGNAVKVLDMAADDRYLYAVDHSGIIWQVDRHRQDQTAQWEVWDTPAGAATSKGHTRRPPNRCITLSGGFMYAVNDKHRLLRTALHGESATDSAAGAHPVLTTDRKWSVVPAWEAISETDEERMPIGITSSCDSVIVACADGTMTEIVNGGGAPTGAEGNAVQPKPQLRVLPLPLLPTALRTEWISLAAAGKASSSSHDSQGNVQSEQKLHEFRLFASALTSAKLSEQSKQEQRPSVHCLRCGVDDMRSLLQLGDTAATAVGAATTVSSRSTAHLQWQLEELSVSTLEPSLSQGDSARDVFPPAEKKQRKSGADPAQQQSGNNAGGFCTAGHEWIGKKVKRMVIGHDYLPTIADAVIVQWWPKGTGKDDPALWKITYVETETTHENQAQPQAGAVMPAALDIVTEDLYEKEARDAIQSATPEGHAALKALQERLLGLDQLAKQRRDDFIRSQPAFAEDQRSGRNSLVSGYLVWVFSEGKWWPAQLYTPLTYLWDYLRDEYSHFFAKEISRSARPESLFVVFLGKQRQFQWVPWRAHLPGSQPQPTSCVHDFRLYHSKHRASVSGVAVLKALNEAEDVLHQWIVSGSGSSASGASQHGRGSQASEPRNMDEPPARQSSKAKKPAPKPTLTLQSTSSSSYNWKKFGHKWVGRRVKRWCCQISTPAAPSNSHTEVVGNRPSPPKGMDIQSGRVVAWQPKAPGQPALWKIRLYSDRAGAVLRKDYEVLNEIETCDAIDCDNPQGFVALQELRQRIMAVDMLCAQRRDNFIRTQPAFVDDERAGRLSLVSGYLIFVKYDRDWWPAQLYTPVTYMREISLYSHTIAKTILKTMKPDSLFVVYLDATRSCGWVPDTGVEDFRLHRSRHLDGMMRNEELRIALKQADDTLARWIASGNDGTIPVSPRLTLGNNFVDHKLKDASNVQASVSQVSQDLRSDDASVVGAVTDDGYDAGQASGSGRSTTNMRTIVDWRVTARGETITTVQWLPACGSNPSASRTRMRTGAGEGTRTTKEGPSSSFSSSTLSSSSSPSSRGSHWGEDGSRSANVDPEAGEMEQKTARNSSSNDGNPEVPEGSRKSESDNGSETETCANARPIVAQRAPDKRASSGRVSESANSSEKAALRGQHHVTADTFAGILRDAARSVLAHYARKAKLQLVAKAIPNAARNLT